MTREDIEMAAGEYSGSLLGFKDNVSVTDKHRAFIAGAEWRINTAWHEATEEPKHGEQILVLFKYGNLTSWFVSDDILSIFKKFDVIAWAYVNDIIPNV